MNYKVGIFGGSFNPIHNGHIEVIEVAKEACNLDKVILVPANISPFKHEKDYVSAEHRLNMCKLAPAELDYVTVSDIEIKRKGFSYTIDTLEYLSKTYKDLYLIIGSDSFMSFDKWYKNEDILKLCKLIVISRKNFVVNNVQKDNIIIVNADISDISSTSIRLSEKYRCFLPLAVLEYVRANSLYGGI
ncbi:MAG: nicotinate (nicotinamide) nucleotide adenylyltransferase [Oscillospiraceae bacterium]|jgi:nicotinate-nucleotide adenylyltransferase|nr:nicotinate (nicotinamide) nucleotide adenylyltransferase [Oscillospiraceae bacterium]